MRFTHRPEIPGIHQDMCDIRKPFFAYGGAAAYAAMWDNPENDTDLNTIVALFIAPMPLDRQHSFVRLVELVASRAGWDDIDRYIKGACRQFNEDADGDH